MHRPGDRTFKKGIKWLHVTRGGILDFHLLDFEGIEKRGKFYFVGLSHLLPSFNLHPTFMKDVPICQCLKYTFKAVEH